MVNMWNRRNKEGYHILEMQHLPNGDHTMVLVWRYTNGDS